MKKILYLVMACVLAPVFISQIIRVPLGQLTIGDESSWVGFFGSYIGGIIGGLVAYFVAKYQIDEQYKKQIANEEMNSFLSQMPSLVKIDSELESMYESLFEVTKSIEVHANEFPDDKFGQDHRGYDLYRLNEEYWNSIDKIDSEDLHVYLLKTKHRYKKISQVLSYNFKNSNRTLTKMIFDELQSNNDDNYEKTKEAYNELEEEIEHNRLQKMNIICNNEISQLIEKISHIKELVRIVLSAIEQEKETRQQIRDTIKN